MISFEQFAAHELKMLREDLQQSGLDTYQVGHLLTAFLSGHCYGVSNDEARHAAARIDSVACTLPRLQEELEKLALVM